MAYYREKLDVTYLVTSETERAMNIAVALWKEKKLVNVSIICKDKKVELVQFSGNYVLVDKILRDIRRFLVSVRLLRRLDCF